MKKFFKKPVFFIIVGILLLILILIISGGKKNKTTVVVSTVARGTVVQEVSSTGRVNPAEDIDLAFERSGKVIRVNVKVGDTVFEGQTLMVLNNADLVAQLEQAQAGLANYQAQLDALLRGSRPEDISIRQTDLKKSQQDLTNDYNGVIDILNDAYNKADDAVNKQNSLFSNPASNPQLTFVTTESQTETDVKNQRLAIETELGNFKSEISFLGADYSAIDQEMMNAERHLDVVRIFLNNLYTTLNGAVNLSQTNLDAYKTSVATARTNINTAMTSINTRQDLIASQKLTVESYQNQLNLILAGSTQEQIAAGRALVKQAQANVDAAQAQLDKTILRSPIKGVVSQLDTKVGEIVSANVNVASVISDAKFEIETNIAEVDIANLKVGNAAKITLDAYGSENVFDAAVVKIDPAEIIIDGVATYKTTLQFTRDDERIRPGMTANIDITTDKRDNILYIPQRAVITKDGQKFVQISGTDDKQLQEVKVELGLRGSDGNIEVINGLKEGDKIINQ
ncbi:MAG: efflux RND transporter periplasmic adaptor subunit [Patescibacteria group bacterium]|nr:efflux RND transporter periplasmic adaptor subunit [Patescibacteria group bacterium]MDD5121488.1 efflux RND transporter periplasmic adaptor subunit [Patescibacteria group bacterium]MDD5221960.1 efflux RND transporter periplasmic adaptor subunit [Patescibacteria group bacterium]MDD5396350.1 efflux RND transporter periplasmic adaptor subunit [Patescibacteria group bacterium]